MTHPSTASSSAASRPCEPWKFWATAAFGLAALAAWFAVQTAAAIFFFAITDGGSGTADDFQRAASNGLFVALATIVVVPFVVGVVAIAVRLARCRFADYLALVWPHRRDVIVSFAIFAVLLPLGDLVTYLSGREITDAFVRDIYRSARDSGTLVLLGLALVVAAPVTEEIVFRGFLLRGFAASRLGGAGAVVLTAAGWAAMHTQYDPYFIGHIFVLGLIFGYFRLRSGSTALPILLHAAINLVSLIQTAVVVEWLL